MDGRDTICALASGSLPSAIAIIRVSGPKSREIADKLLDFGCPPTRRAVLTTIRALDGCAIDEGLAIFMAGPASYTGEDSLELNLHGGRAVVAGALDALTSLEGVRLAEPGEFTRRAFEAGRLDLTQAEAIADLIEAETEGQRRQALGQLSGALRAVYDQWQTDLTGVMALLEVSIDFPDEDEAPTDTSGPVQQRIERLISELEAALADDGIGERIRDGFRVAIVGAPNAGKSTLLNRFAKRDAAIVTEIAGTTRDVIDVRLALAGQVVWLSDTAGLRETTDRVEAEGVKRAMAAADRADIRIFLIDGTTGVTAFGAQTKREDDFIVLNKTDGPIITPTDRFTHSLSALTGDGFAELEADLATVISRRVVQSGSAVITRARHREGLSQALVSLKAARETLLSHMGAEFVAEDVRLAARQLAGLLGEIDVERILGSVFSEFCIGK